MVVPLGKNLDLVHDEYIKMATTGSVDASQREYLFVMGQNMHILFFSDGDVESARDEAYLLGLHNITYNLGDNLTAFIFYRPGHVDKAKRLKHLLARKAGRSSKVYQQTEREIGEVLGYEAWHINAYLANNLGAEYKKGI